MAGQRTLFVAPLALLITFAIQSPAIAITLIDGTTLDIDANTPVDGYQLENGATLNAQDASMSGLTARGGSTVNMTGGSVLGTSNAVTTVNISGSTLNLSGGRITGVNNRGLSVSTLPNGQGGQAVVTDSEILGATAGVSVTSESTLTLINSTVTGTGANSLGLLSLSGTIHAQGGSISGGAQGISISTGANNGVLVLDGTQVTGQSGAAIRFFAGSTSDVDILNGATLTGGNGTIFEVVEGSNATVRVSQSDLTGNINISDTSTGDFTFDNGRLTGDLIVAQGGTATLALNNTSVFTGRMENVQDVSIDSTSHWMMTGDSSVTNLNLNGGRVTLGDTDSFYTLNLETLAGNGTFVMGSNFATNETDFLNITGEAQGNHDLLISASGSDPAAGVPLQVVHTGGGDAQFSLVGGAVDLGAYSYSLKQEGNDWFLDPESRTISPGTKTVMALFGAPPTVFYGELTTLRSRMGELRYSEGRSSGVWMRAHGSQYNVADASSGVGYTQNQQGMSFGADAPLPYGDGQWLIGALAGYSKSDLNLNYGTSGTVDSYYVGGYATWLDAKSGYYVDTVIKYNRYQNKAKVGLSDGERTKGDYDNHGIGGSVEVGRHIKLNDGYFVEPYVQIAGTVIQSKD